MWKVQHSRWTVVLRLEWSVLQWTLCGRYSTAGGQWYWGLNGVCYSEQYVEATAQQVDSGIEGWMECVTVNIMWKVQHSRWTVVLRVEWNVLQWTVRGRYCTKRWTMVLWVEWSVLQWTVCGRYNTAGGQWYWGLNGMCYSELYVEGTAQQVDSGIVGWMLRVKVNSMWKVLHSRWTVVLCVECSVLQWTLCGRYYTGGGQWYCGLNGVCYSEQYVEDTAKQVDRSIVGWMNCVRVNIMRKVLHSRWTVVLCVECSVLQWTLCRRYCTAGGLCYCGLNVVCYSEHYVEGIALEVDSGIVGWMECVTVNIKWKGLHSRWTVVLWIECCVLQWPVCGRYCTTGGQLYCGLNVVCYSEQYVEGTAQQLDSGIVGWM